MRRKNWPLPPRGTFERRVLLALVLFSVLPALAVLGVGTYALSRAMTLTGVSTAWERVAESGRVLLERADASGDPELARAAARHREELSGSLVQARRWDYLLQRSLGPLLAGMSAIALLILVLALRSSRRMARGLARPIATLVDWSQRVARSEPLPPDDPAGSGELRRLSDALRSMAAELEASRARALEAERVRAWASMARGVAHEIKNPLTPIRLAVRTLHRQPGAETPAAAEALEVITAEAERLEELARSFSQFAWLPEGPMSEVDLRELFDYLLRTHLPPGAGRLRAGVGLPPVHGHHDALARAFANLLLNAGEAIGERGGSVTVTLAALADGVEVRVTDTGPGIDPQHLERIWEPDFTTKRSGTGLGLALVRQTVQAHGGSVRAANRAEGGAEFRVRLPAASYRLPATGNSGPPPPAPSPTSGREGGTQRRE